MHVDIYDYCSDCDSPLHDCGRSSGLCDHPAHGCIILQLDEWEEKWKERLQNEVRALEVSTYIRNANVDDDDKNIEYAPWSFNSWEYWWWDRPREYRAEKDEFKPTVNESVKRLKTLRSSMKDSDSDNENK